MKVGRFAEEGEAINAGWPYLDYWYDGQHLNRIPVPPDKNPEALAGLLMEAAPKDASAVLTLATEYLNIRDGPP